MPQDFLSIIVPCRNERRHIGALLASILGQQTGGLQFEVLIADGMSDDGTLEVLRNLSDSRVVVIPNPARIVSAGLNAAIRKAKGNIILRMDCHTEYAQDYVRQCVAALRRTGAGNVGGAARTRAHGFTARAIAAAYHSRFSTGGAKFHDRNYEGWVDTVTYGCWYRSTLEQLGLFDEALIRNQDDELNLRLIRSGGKIWQSRAIVSWYSPRNSLRQLFHQYFQYGFWKVPVIRKHRIPASWRHLAPGLFLVGNAALLACAPFSRAALEAWLLLTGAYVLGCSVASLAAARRYGWELLPILPTVFAVYHSSYGLGFLYGLLHWSIAGRESQGIAKAFTAISR